MNQKQDLKIVYEFLKNAKVFYIASIDGDCARVRPFGIVHIFEDKLYIHTGRSKKCYQQFIKNKVEICAMYENSWIRLSGKLIDDKSIEAEKSLAAAYPDFYQSGSYKVGDGNNCVMYFTDAIAIISSFGKEDLKLEF